MKLLQKTISITKKIASKNAIIDRLATPIIDATDSFLFRAGGISCGNTILRDWCDNKRYMFTVMIALFPILFFSIYLFGWRMLSLVAVSYAVGVGIEAIFAAVRRHPINEGAFVTCLIYPLILPPHIPLWMAAVGIAFGTIFAKEVFGGTGHNIFNPAMVGRVFLAISFSLAMTTGWVEPTLAWPGALHQYAVDTISSATPLSLFSRGHELTNIVPLLIGNIGGSVGETSKLLIIPCGLFLLVTKVANWRTVLAIFVSVVITSWIGNSLLPDRFAPTLFQLLSGGLLFGMFFMATDPVTSTHTQTGKYFFGAIVGTLTVLIRAFTGYIEGFMFALLFANAFAPLIDHIILKQKYGKDFIA
ncbi:MAG: RnfABCDGE type electron transport complex subunit D [Pseudomonadota bacterium]